MSLLFPVLSLVPSSLLVNIWWMDKGMRGWKMNPVQTPIIEVTSFLQFLSTLSYLWAGSVYAYWYVFIPAHRHTASLHFPASLAVRFGHVTAFLPMKCRQKTCMCLPCLPHRTLLWPSTGSFLLPWANPDSPIKNGESGEECRDTRWKNGPTGPWVWLLGLL